MIEDRPEDVGPAPDPGRPKRPPPTIDLEATEVSGETQKAAGAAPSEPDPKAEAKAEAEPEPKPKSKPESKPPEPGRPPSAAVSPWAVAAVSGAVAASLVIAVGWMLGWPPVQAPTAAPQVNAAVIDDLTARIADAESKVSKPATDSAAATRADALEKSLGALRGELAAARAQSEKLAAAVNDIKSSSGSAASPDLSEINERLAQIERTTRAQSAEIAQDIAKPADDVPLRRIVAAALLDVLVRIGDPYPAALAAAKSLAPNADALKPLEDFAASGVPSAAVLSRDLLTLVPKLTPPAPPETTATSSGILDRLQSGAAKLVRIERTDAVGDGRNAVVARATAAALRNEYSEARRELKTLAPADRAAAQGWLDKADARDAALAASRGFAADAMAALAKPAP